MQDVRALEWDAVIAAPPNNVSCSAVWADFEASLKLEPPPTNATRKAHIFEPDGDVFVRQVFTALAARAFDAGR